MKGKSGDRNRYVSDVADSRFVLILAPSTVSLFFCDTNAVKTDRLFGYGFLSN